MASIFTHGFAAFTIGNVFFEKYASKKMLIAGIVCSMIPDADVIGFAFGIPYQSLWGHRGFTHSVFFAVLLAAIVTLLLNDRKNIFSKTSIRFFLFLFLATVSHPLLDMFTNGGLGVALLAPFSPQRYFFPFRPILVSPLGASRFFSSYGLRILLSEFAWVWLPCILLMIVFKMRKFE